jgi:predicted Zn-dependent protease
VVALPEVMGHHEGPVAAAAAYEFAVDQFPDFALLRMSLEVELIKAGRLDDAKRVLKVAVQQDPQLLAVILDHLGLDSVL